jgi:hypothetical protein
MKIQFASQMYHAVQRMPFSKLICPSAPVLVLAGNTINPWSDAGREFLKTAAFSFDKVFVIPGVEEHRSRIDICYKKNLDKLMEVVYKYNNTALLNNHKYDISNNYMIVGNTLWNHLVGVPGQSIEDMTGINERRRIIGTNEFIFDTITKDAIQNQYMNNRDYIKHTVLDPENTYMNMAVATYHVPCFDMLTKEDKSRYSTAIMSGNELHYCMNPMKVWIGGAGEGAAVTRTKEVLFVKNARGDGDTAHPTFRVDAVVDVTSATTTLDSPSAAGTAVSLFLK